MHHANHQHGNSPEERLILARFATRARRASRHHIEKLTHGAFVAL
jgi:hypothetical protein